MLEAAVTDLLVGSFLLRDSKRIRSRSARDSAACSSAWSALFRLDRVAWAVLTTFCREDQEPDSGNGIKMLSETQMGKKTLFDDVDVREKQTA